MDVQNHARNFVALIKFHTVHSLILAFNLDSVYSIQSFIDSSERTDTFV